jgi:protein arginine N-methyltransferase 1
MYSIHDYGDMTGERRRTDAYAAALRARVAPGSVVLDIGAGPGILTLLACQAGAQRVYAVEPDGIIQVARETIAANGYADRVVFMQALSTAVTLPEKVDVIVSDIHGVLPLFCGSLTAIIDARERFLKPHGFLIPATETLWVAVVTAPTLYRRIVEPWEGNVGLDFTAARRRAVNTWGKWQATQASLVVEPKLWSVLDYRELGGPNVRGTARWTVPQACEAHGLCMWFDCETATGTGFSNSPCADQLRVYNQGFFPWPEARSLEPGDEVSVDIRADLVGDDYIWSWNSSIRGPNGRGPVKAQYRQTNFLSAPVSEDWLHKSAASFVPSPNDEASIDGMILDLLFAGISLEEISRRVADRFPQRFPEWRKALTRVGDLSLRYSG